MFVEDTYLFVIFLYAIYFQFFIKKLLLYLCYLVFYLLFLQLPTVKWGDIEQFSVLFLNDIEKQTDVFAYRWTCSEKLTLD